MKNYEVSISCLRQVYFLSFILHKTGAIFLIFSNVYEVIIKE